MKVLMLNYEFPPMGGGAGNATDNISKEMVKMGHDLTVLTSGYGHLPKFVLKDGVKIYRVFSWRKGIHDCGFRGAYTYLFSAAFKLLSLKKTDQFDIIHYFFSLPTGLLSLVPWAFRRTPYIVSLRGSDVPYYDIYNSKVHFLNLALKPVNKYIWKKAKRVIALSEGLKTTALNSATNQPIGVIPNGVETDIFKPVPGQSKSSKKLRLITVSRLINRKGIDHILKSLSELKDDDITLLVVGTGNYESYLKKVCHQLGLDNTVTFYGYCPRERLSQLYNKADVFILPSLAESFGIVFAEAMACGLPVIGGRTGGVPDLVKEDNGILVNPGKIDDITNAIITLKTNCALREKMGITNRKKVVDAYSWYNVAQSYLSIYRAVIDS
ncbi:MAG: glycosyltransferase family 4 protein [Deltaproteobacteria bacterium]|jgi:glycosyltransferase involved in cell wall biosynthesis|nr:glycosyltransferase family 4 protein [Deltaproteobacteria bacterium]